MPLARTLQVTYAGVTLGGSSSGRHIDEYTINEDSPERAVFECIFVTKAVTTVSDFATECAAVEVLATPRGALVVSDGGNTLLSLSHSSNTGFDGVATITKVGKVGDTGLSRRYRFRFECGRPADSRYNTSGRRTGTVDVKYDPSNRRHVTFRATYTALSGNGARTQMESAFSTWCTGWMSTIGITNYQKAEMPATPGNDTDKVLEAVAVYDELVYTSGIFADTSVIRAEMKISREKVAPGDTPDADRLAVVNAQFDCWVDKTVTTALQSKYASIRSTVVAQIRTALELGQICLVSDRAEFDWVNNKISATMTLFGTTGGSVLEYRYTTDMSKETGLVILPAWTGDPLSAFVTPGPARYINTITITRRRLGLSRDVGNNASPVAGADAFNALNAADQGAGAPGGDSAGAGSGGGAGAPNATATGSAASTDAGTPMAVPLSSRMTKTPLRLGTKDEATIDVTDEVEVTVTQTVKRIGGTGDTSPVVVTPDVHPELNQRA